MTGLYAERLLDHDLPWTKMRRVCRLLGLVKRYGPAPVETACARALDLDVVSVTKIAAMLEQAIDNIPIPPPRPEWLQVIDGGATGAEQEEGLW